MSTTNCCARPPHNRRDQHICHQCRRMITTTFMYDSSNLPPNVLPPVCSTPSCDKHALLRCVKCRILRLHWWLGWVCWACDRISRYNPGSKWWGHSERPCACGRGRDVASCVFAWVHVIPQLLLGAPVLGERAFEFVDGEGGVEGVWIEHGPGYIPW